MKHILFILFAALSLLLLTACEVPTNATSSPAEEKKQAITVSEKVLLDESGLKISVTSFREKGHFGPELILLVENKSGKDLSLQSKNSSVNGCMVKSMLYAYIPNGDTGYTTLSFSKHDLALSEIDTISDMEFSFHVYDSNSGEVFLDSSPIEVKTSASDTYLNIHNSVGKVAYDQNGVKIVIEELLTDYSTLGPSIVVSIENNSDRKLGIKTKNVSINRVRSNGRFSTNVLPEKRVVDTMAFLWWELKEDGITDIKSAELSFEIFDYHSGDTIYTTKPTYLDF